MLLWFLNMKYLGTLLALFFFIASAFATPDQNATFLVERGSLKPYNPAGPKRGLPYSEAQYLKNFNIAGSQVSWAYNWASDMDPAFPTNLEYVPMLWGDGADHTNIVSEYQISPFEHC